MANIIHGVNFKYTDEDGKEQHRCYGYYSMCLGGLQGNIPANMAVEINEELACDLHDEAGYDDEFEYVMEICAGREPEPEGFIMPEPYSMHVWPMCTVDNQKRERLKGRGNMPLGDRWRETIKYAPKNAVAYYNNHVTIEEYIDFLRWFCYRTRFSTFFVNVPKNPRELTAEWIVDNGLELSFYGGSERDWSFAYTTVRAITKAHACNFRAFHLFKGDYTTDLQKLVLWHTLQQASWRDGEFTDKTDGCHCISHRMSWQREGYAYRVMYPNVNAPSLADTGKIASAKTNYFIVDFSKETNKRNHIHLYGRGDSPEVREMLRNLITDEIAYCSALRASNKFNDK